MALVNCVDCGKSISDRAAACIHCGAPLRADGLPSRNVALTEPQIAYLVKALVNSRADLLLLLEDKAGLIVTAGREFYRIRPITGPQILTMLREIASPVVFQRIDDNSETEFVYTFSEGAFKFHVTRENDELQVLIGPWHGDVTPNDADLPIPLSSSKRECLEGYLDGLTDRPAKNRTRTVNGQEKRIDGYDEYMRGFRDGAQTPMRVYSCIKCKRDVTPDHTSCPYCGSVFTFTRDEGDNHPIMDGLNEALAVYVGIKLAKQYWNIL
jgi:DNA-directed RNA polymerase subunit RPC12/RpoP